MKLRAEHMIVGTTCVGVLLSGCGGEQSVLEPKGDGAHSISLLAQVLFISGAAVLMIVVVALLLALRGPERLRAKLSGERAIVAGGIAFPSIVLTALLTYGFLTMRPTDPGLAPVRIAVEGGGFGAASEHPGACPDAEGEEAGGDQEELKLARKGACEAEIIEPGERQCAGGKQGAVEEERPRGSPPDGETACGGACFRQFPLPSALRHVTARCVFL